MEFRIDIIKGNNGVVLKVTADCRSVGDVAELIAALKLARHTLGPPADGAKARGGARGGLARDRCTVTGPAQRDRQQGG